GVFGRSNSRPSFDHRRRAAERGSPLAERLLLQTEGASLYHGMHSRTPLEECTQLVPRATAFPTTAGPPPPALRVAPLPIHGRRSCRLARAARAPRVSLGASVPIA